MAWRNDELEKIGAAKELEIQTTREDGMLRNPVTIWVVRAGDDLYVRSVMGTAGKWYSHALGQQGHISAGGVEKHVRFEKDGDDMNNAVDAAYRSKYSAYLETVLTLQARESTLRLLAG
jgi:hypothetical protein